MADSTNNIKQKIYHMLMGIAYGDAMGMPTETLTPETIHAKFGKVTTFQECSPDLGLPLNREMAAGRVTDDTENSVFISRMLVDTGGIVDSEVFIKYLIHWLDTDPNSEVVTGPSTKKAVALIRSGVAISESGRTGTTNGAAMKMGPIALISPFNDIAGLLRNVTAICMPTHNTTIAIQGAGAVAAAASYLFDCDSDASWEEYKSIVLHTVLAAEAYGCTVPSVSILKRIELAWKIADTYREPSFSHELYSSVGTGLETVETVPAALAIVYRYRGDLSKCIETAANIGGDTDTIGAICGAICGAYRYNIKPELERVLLSVNSIDFAQLAQDLASIVVSQRENHYVH